jgi:hypothetical protein
MKFLTKISASFLLSLGFICLMATASKFAELGDNNTRAEDKQEVRTDAFMGTGLSASFLAGGGYLLWGLRKKNQKQISDRLDSTFYRMLKADTGRITVLHLAMEARISGQEAKQYLDLKAKEFNASFDTSEEGSISYRFDV